MKQLASVVILSFMLQSSHFYCITRNSKLICTGSTFIEEIYRAHENITEVVLQNLEVTMCGENKTSLSTILPDLEKIMLNPQKFCK